MVFEKYFGIGESFWGWRCVSCGEIIDAVIQKNRKEFQTKRMGYKST
jgi:hypothetical protein